MGDVKKVPVKIRGREYRVSCTEDSEYIEKIAYYVDKKIEKVSSSNSSLDTLDASILVSLNLADELFKAVNLIDKLALKSGTKVNVEEYCEIEKIQKGVIPKEDTENS